MTSIYHITHINNLPNILADGGLWCDQIVSERNLAHIGIAHQHIKDRRAQKAVPCAPGGRLADFVPFYFAPRSPMLYAIHKGNVEGYRDGQRPILHLVASAETVQAAGLPFAFTDGHAPMVISRFFNDLQDLHEVDWRMMNSQFWANTLEDGDRKRRRQAEFLIKRFFAFTLIETIGVIDQNMAQQVSALLQFIFQKTRYPDSTRVVLLVCGAAMIQYTNGNLLQANVEAIINTVNTVGVMGKGIALQFKQAFPANFKAYEKAAKRGEILPGKMFVFETGSFANPRYIINFPTKRHWRDKSRLEDIESGLDDLANIIQQKNIQSIAIPPLGCGFGGLNWKDVQPLIISSLENLPNVHAWVYPPSDAPAPATIPVGTNRPDLTLGRAALLELIDLYMLPGDPPNLLEIQKLAFFLQMAGEQLKLNYVKQQYGPYAENLNFVLQRLDGHYLRGYGARSGQASLQLLPGAKQEAESFLSSYPETKERLQRIAQLIQGFETPYGMELLSTILWLSQEDANVKQNPEAAVRGFEAWNQRKREHFRPEHIQVAWNRLRQQGWL